MACEGQILVALPIKTLQDLCNNDSFDFIRDLLRLNTASLDLPESTIPRKHKKPTRYLREQETPWYN